MFGTNTGRLFLSLTPTVDAQVPRKGILRVSDDSFGISTFDAELDIDGSVVRLRGTPVPTANDHPDLQIGVFGALAKFSDSGTLIGEWETSIGTAGTFNLYPHGGQEEGRETSTPNQLYVSSRDIGALRLYRPDIDELLETLQRKFPQSKAVISYMDRGAERSMYADEFENAVRNIEKLTALRITLQAPAGAGFRKILTIDLGQIYNRVTTNGPDESWVLGEAEATVSSLRLREQKLSTAIGRYRININQIVFLAALVLMPDLPLQERAIFFSSVIVLIFLADKITVRLVSNFAIDLKRDRPNFWESIGPTALSWLVSATSGIAASVVYGLLQ
jgi:hypothetical protein